MIAGLLIVSACIENQVGIRMKTKISVCSAGAEPGQLDAEFADDVYVVKRVKC